MTSILLYDKDTFILIIMFYVFLYIFCKSVARLLISAAIVWISVI